MKINKNNPVPLYIQVKEALLSEINNNYKTGDKIPSEVSLMEIFGVGRTTIRDAIKELVTMGVVEKKHGFGTFVAKKNLSSAIRPFISLSFNLQNLGLSQYNEVLVNELIDVPNNLSLIFSLNQKLLHVKRKRWVNEQPLVIEDSWLTQRLYKFINEKDLSSSIASVIVEKANVKIDRFEQSVKFRDPTDEEKNILNLEEGNRIISLKRTLYIEGENNPIFYLEFLTSELVLPALGFSI